MRCFSVLAALASGSLAAAGPIATRTQLDSILGDQMLLEDFEGLSVHGGTTAAAPNPLNSSTAPSGWGILSGVTYSSTDLLRLYGGYLHGDDSVILQSTGEMLVTFHEPQRAVGFDIVDSTGNIPYHDVVTFYHGTVVLGTLEFDLGSPGDAFVGWEDAAVGITAARVVCTTVSFGLASVDNVEWGAAVASCTPDLNLDNALDFFDVQAFLNAFAAHNPLADLTRDGLFDFFDVQAFLQAFAQGCP